MQHISANVQFGHKQFENPSKIPIVVTVKAKGYSQLEYILHLFLKITISAYYNYLQVKIIFLSNMEPVYLLLPPWQVSPNWGRTHCGTNTSIQSLNTHFQPLAFLNQTSSRSRYHSDKSNRDHDYATRPFLLTIMQAVIIFMYQHGDEVNQGKNTNKVVTREKTTFPSTFSSSWKAHLA